MWFHFCLQRVSFHGFETDVSVVMPSFCSRRGIRDSFRRRGIMAATLDSTAAPNIVHFACILYSRQWRVYSQLSYIAVLIV